jgi:hypothetical protein
MMQSCASAAKLRGGGSILQYGLEARSDIGSPPPRIVLGDRRQSPAVRGQIFLSYLLIVHDTGRRATPAGTSPVVTKRQREMSSLRANATIMVLILDFCRSIAATIASAMCAAILAVRRQSQAKLRCAENTTTGAPPRGWIAFPPMMT